jgi:hypothetical protein
MADNQQRNPNPGNQGNQNQGGQKGNQNPNPGAPRNPNDRDRTRAMEDEQSGRADQSRSDIESETLEENR